MSIQKICKLYTCDWPWIELEIGKKYELELRNLNQTPIDASEEFSDYRFVDYYDDYEEEISKLKTKKVNDITYGLINCFTVSIDFEELFNCAKYENDYIDCNILKINKIWTVLDGKRLPSEEELKKVLKYRKR